MGLINLLSVGRSLIGVSHGTGHYKLAQGNLLPNFGGARPTGGAAAGAAGAPAGGSVGKAAERAVMGSKSAAPVRGTGQGELKLEVPTAVKPAVTEPPKAATAATAAVTAVNAVAASPATAAVAETKTAPATAATMPAAPAAARPRAEEKFTLGRWVSLMLNR